MPGKTVIRVREGDGQLKTIGHVEGDTFTAAPRRMSEHLFRGGAPDASIAIRTQRAAWGLDVAAMEILQARGIKYVVIPVPLTGSYRARLEDVLGPESFRVEYGGHRPQAMLPLQHWVLRARAARRKVA